jgi:hypothetical protein
MRNLREDEMKALLAVLIAGGFVLLSMVALELVSIRRSLRRIERDDRQLVVVIQRDLQTIHPARFGDGGQAPPPRFHRSGEGDTPLIHSVPLDTR